jgi:hypothetical protein
MTFNSSVVVKTVTMLSGRITDGGKFGGNCLYSKTNATAGQYTCVVSPGFTTTGDFTVEMWINLENYGSANSSGRGCILFTTKGNLTTNTTGYMLMIGTNSKFLLLKDASSTYVTSTTSFVANTWQHLAFVRKNGLVTLYVDGVADASITNLASAATQTYGTDIGVGSFPGSTAGDAAWNANGKIDEFAVFPYAKYTSNFNPSTLSEYPNTSVITTDPSNVVLAHFKVSDNSIVNYATYADATFPTTSAGAAVMVSPVGMPKNSSLFNANALRSYEAALGNYSLRVSNLTLGTNSFTMQGWFYPISSTSGCYIYHFGTAVGNPVSWFIFLTSAGVLQYYPGSGSTLYNITTLAFNEWHHIAFKRTGTTTFTIIINGQVYNYSGLSNYSFGNTAGVGSSIDSRYMGINNFNGYITELRADNIVLPDSFIQNYYNNVTSGTYGSFPENNIVIDSSYPGGLGGNGAWGSGGGGGGASTYNTGSLVGTRQGGNGGDGYVAIISYK